MVDFSALNLNKHYKPKVESVQYISKGNKAGLKLINISKGEVMAKNLAEIKCL